MWGKLSILGIILLAVCCPLILAADASQQVDVSNRLLSAAVIQQMEQQKTEMLVELKGYQDENFQALDTQMRALIANSRDKVFIGGVGAILIANSIVAIVMSYFWRKYSYQTYVEQQGAAMATVQPQSEVPGQQSWDGYTQQPLDNITSQIGEGQAAQVNMMNQWQAKPAYAGSWVPPMQRLMLDDDLPSSSSNSDKMGDLERLKMETDMQETKELNELRGS